MSIPNTNILICGKSGVGKSSLLNYLLGKSIAVVGHGKPTTGEDIYKCPPLQHNNMSFTIYDSYGLEAGKEEKWRKIIEKEIQRNQTEEMRDWFHSVVYCVDAQRARVEHFEINDILRPLMADGNRILFVLTKSSLDSQKTDATEKELRQAFPLAKLVRVESVAEETYTGKTEQKGREELLEKFILNMRENILYKAISKYQREAIADVRSNFTSGVLKYFDEETSVISHFGDDLMQKITDFAKNHLKSIFDKHTSVLYDDIAATKSLLAQTGAALQQGTPLPKFFPLSYTINLDDFWENSSGDYFATIMASIIFPLGLLVRKDIYKDKIREGCVKANDKAEQKIKELATKMYEYLSIPQIMKEQTYGEIIKKGDLSALLDKVEKDLQKQYHIGATVDTASTVNLIEFLNVVERRDKSRLKELYERHGGSSVDDLVMGLRRDASNSVWTILGDPVEYAECVRRVAEQLKISEKELCNSVRDNEMIILQTALKKYLAKLNPAEREGKLKDFANTVGKENSDSLPSSGPAYRKIIPSVLNIALLRLEFTK